MAVVTFADAPLLARFEAGLGLTGLELYGDPERRAYAELGFGRASGARVWLDPRVWRRYAGLLARGRTPRPPQGQDTLQLGGDVLADAQGRIEWIHRSAGPEDRPSIAEIERRAS